MQWVPPVRTTVAPDATKTCFPSGKQGRQSFLTETGRISASLWVTDDVRPIACDLGLVCHLSLYALTSFLPVSSCYPGICFKQRTLLSMSVIVSKFLGEKQCSINRQM